MRMELNAPRLKRIVPCVLVAAVALATVVLTIGLFARPTPPKLEALLSKYAPAEETEDGKEPGKNGSLKPNSPKPVSAGGDRVKLISQRHTFSKPKPFRAQLTGVLGDKAYFQGDKKGYKSGDRFGQATVKVVGADWAEIEVDGKTQKLQVFSGTSFGGGSSRGMMAGRPPLQMPPGVKLPPGVVVPSGPMPPAMMMGNKGSSNAMPTEFVESGKAMRATTQRVNP